MTFQESKRNLIKNLIPGLLLDRPKALCYLFGSSVTVDPPVTDTDIDVAVWGVTMQRAISMGFEVDANSQHYEGAPFTSMRHKEDETINLVLFSDLGSFFDHKLAAGLCKRLNLKDREDRLAVFDCIRGDGQVEIIRSSVPEYNRKEDDESWLN